jgi:methyl-accepting chemotaxis protein
MMLRRLSIAQRLLLFMPVLLTVLVVVLSTSLVRERRILVEDRQEELRNLVRVALGVIDSSYQKEKAGLLTESAAQDAARNELRSLRFGRNDYFFVVRYDGLTMVHIDRSVEGKNRINAVDSDGNLTVKDQIAAAQRGGGFAYYRNPRGQAITGSSNAQELVPKMSYAVGFDPWQWAIGTGVYIDDIDTVYRGIIVTDVVISVVLLLLGCWAAFTVGRTISRPLGLITDRMTTLTGGNREVDVPFLDDRNEMGRLAQALAAFKANLQKTEEMAQAEQAAQAAKQARQQAVEHAVGGFQQRAGKVIEDVARAAEKSQALARRLSDLAEQSRNNIDTVGQAATNSTGNVQAVATAAEELSAAVNEVNRRIVRSTEVARRAVAETESTSTTVHGLADAAQRIGNIVQVIQGIASQTNLLALNATIEAARAGDAGKGFAVVASEVKTLANQTTKATEEIQQQIGAIQSETGRAVGAIGAIGKTVEEVNEIAEAIAAAMQQQGATTHEIARNISEAAARTGEVSANVSEVGEVAQTTTSAATELREASDKLRNNASQLEQEMQQFVGEMRAA